RADRRLLRGADGGRGGGRDRAVRARRRPLRPSGAASAGGPLPPRPLRGRTVRLPGRGRRPAARTAGGGGPAGETAGRLGIGSLTEAPPVPKPALNPLTNRNREFAVNRRKFLSVTAGSAGALFLAGGCGGGGDTLKIASSLPRTGSAQGQTDTIVNGIK